MPAELAASFNVSSSAFMFVTKNPRDSGEIIIQAPVGHAADNKQVEIGTSVIVLLGFLYLLHAAWHTASSLSIRNHRVKSK